MKRLGNLYEDICSVENLQMADKKARRGKSDQVGIKSFDRNYAANILQLHDMLIKQTYKTSSYTTFKIFEPKERLVYRLPYFPDRITHHAIMNILEPMFIKTFTTDTYSCIKGKGIHGMANAIKKALKNPAETAYCLKLDIKKFYPNITHRILKHLLRRKIKDDRLLWLLDEIIDSAAGVPIGNYLSQYFANFYLSGFDHWVKEENKVHYYFRYADDMVILSGSKEFLRNMLIKIQHYLMDKLKLELKSNNQIFPVSARGIDVVGYKFFQDYTLLRKSIKQNFARMLSRRRNAASIASYNGWAVHCNSRNLLKKLLHEKI